MADVNLSNSASVTGTYETGALTLTSNVVTTEIVNGITIVKAADKEKWSTGQLTYTITIENNAQNTLESPTVVDILDPTLVKLVDNSVKVNSSDAQYTYEETTGTLSINLEDMTVGTTSVITFRVLQK